MSTTWLFLLPVVVALVLIGPTQSFKPLFVFNGNSISHREITTRAVLQKTAEVCQSIAAGEGLDFSLTIDDTLTAERVHEACSSSRKSTSLMSTVSFYSSIAYIYFQNANVDLVYALSNKHHFDSETFQKGRDLITQGVSAVKASVKLENFIAGRSTLGQLCHTLQDFYSHSNWVELGYTVPYHALIKPDKPLENLAGPNVPTCRNCAGRNCNNNLLPNVLEKRLLTSGYFNILSSKKPKGKCSHGGCFDQTSKQEPVGGINKDDMRSSHGSLHTQSANLAVIATMDLLEDIRVAVGENNFLRLMGLSQSSVLCFVIDTTGSMRDDIAQAKTVAFNIIDSKRGTLEEPSAYILVPFNDPGMQCFGPLLATTDTNTFKEWISALTPSGGGDNPELSLSGLQLALTAAPPLSEIFVFTDAPAKDAHLKSTITALIESTKSVVTFLLTDVLSSRRKKSLQDVFSRVVGQIDVQLYRDLARASGGQAIEVSKSDLALATSVIEDSSGSSMVTVFQGERNPGKPDHFTFNLDDSLTNVTIYITGTSSLSFNLISSTGISQSSSESSGPLVSLNMAGNLRRLRLNDVRETGLWKISVDSYDPYSVKVTGQSPVNFIYNLVEAFKGLHADLFLKEGRPLSDGKATFLVTVTGSESVNVTEVTLCDSSSETKVNGTLQSLGGSNFLVTFTEIPMGDFVVRLRGEDRSSSSRSTPSRFQRQASTQIKTSNISVTAEANSTNIEPGSTASIHFIVTSTASGVGTFIVRATNDCSFDSTSPSSITIKADSRGKANSTVTLTVPDSATSGTDVTLTIEVEDPAADDINYVVLRFSITAKVTDFNGPVWLEVSTTTNCSSSLLCDSSQWQFIANVTDGVNGTGIERVTIREGNGTLNTTTVVGPGGENITVASFQSSCCVDRVELSLVDNVGNVGICVGQVRQLTTVAPVTGSSVMPCTTSTGGDTLSTMLCICITVVTFPLWI
ncbi:von Willebrand factor A domain-containing protein 7-like [Syngnathoides biaculeatus]|uniref:von Willebrand factor A domain-containing protein 7-like n=1 Tax=Syngnathoides biaculeatus TaxID=300417 RepID=UPI002ADD829E|nr:von Willebrand factor A domain-containing protein 7-like [Syngnathoides biaculeatus]